MFKFDIRCLFHGDNFSPTLVEKKIGVPLDEKIEVGDIGKIGRYKNKMIPYGSACLRAIKTEGACLETALKGIVDVLMENIKSFRSHGAESIILHFDVNYDNQCNLEFSPELIKKISILEIPLTISCYKKWE